MSQSQSLPMETCAKYDNYDKMESAAIVGLIVFFVYLLLHSFKVCMKYTKCKSDICTLLVRAFLMFLLTAGVAYVVILCNNPDKICYIKDELPSHDYDNPPPDVNQPDQVPQYDTPRYSSQDSYGASQF